MALLGEAFDSDGTASVNAEDWDDNTYDIDMTKVA